MSKAGDGKGLPKGKAGSGPNHTSRRQKAPGPKKLNVAGYGIAKNQKGPPKGPKPPKAKPGKGDKAIP